MRDQESNGSFVGYVPDPNGRGTPTLILSCLLTLVLCVWSALHLNVPQKGEKVLTALLLYVRWITTGVFAPELVAFTAWRQWCSARLLSKKIACLVSESQTEKGYNHSWKVAASSVQRQHKWTLTHSFYASTGGFAFEIDDADSSNDFLPKDCSRRLTLTARGAAILADRGPLPDIPEADILDKSKTNSLAKSMVIVQALWMLLQVLGRLIAGLPVTLLEVNTVAHVLCALLVYLLWWNKPMSLNEPVILHGDGSNAICAFMFMCSEISGKVNKHEIKSETLVKTALASFHLYSKRPEIERLAFAEISKADDNEAQLLSAEAPSSTIHPEITPQCSAEMVSSDVGSPGSAHSRHFKRSFHLASRASLDDLRKRRQKAAAGTAFFERRPKVQEKDDIQQAVDDRTRKRWSLAAQAMSEYPELIAEQPHVEHNGCLHYQPQELLVARVQNWPWDDLLRDIDGLMVGMILWLASFAYGALHAAAWNDYFPSVAEMWLWRASAVYIAFCGGLWIVLNFGARSLPRVNAYWDRWQDGKAPWWQYVIIGPTVVVCGSSFLLARAFIVVEAFVSVRSLPAGAYDTPNWSQVFPHF